MPDIDIDLANRKAALSLLDHIPASRVDNESKTLVRHSTGVYLHSVPVDGKLGVCTIPFNEADDHGFFKIDFLNVSIYSSVKDESHLNQLVNREPNWDLLQHREFSDLVFHLNGHSGILREMKPTSVEQLAAVISMIRPAKRHLIGKDWNTIFEEVWVKPMSGEYYFKKSHAISYAMAIVVHMNLLCEEAISVS